MNQEPLKEMDFSPLFSTKSSRHHYIPVFLLDGFKNTEGLIYVYDKRKERILAKPRPPGSIFFESKRNTIQLDSATETSILEDRLFSRIDNDASKIVRAYQQMPLKEVDFSIEDTGRFLFFIVTLFWRIPYTDNAAEDLMNRSLLSASGIDVQKLQNDPAYRKIMRSGLFQHHIEEMRKFGPKGKKQVNLHQFSGDVFVIGDNPILFKRPPNTFREFDSLDYLIAISSCRIYSSSQTSFTPDTLTPALYNACVIQQSVRYIGSGNKTVLEESIRLHNELEQKGLLYSLTDQLFK